MDPKESYEVRTVPNGAISGRKTGSPTNVPEHPNTISKFETSVHSRELREDLRETVPEGPTHWEGPSGQ